VKILLVGSGGREHAIVWKLVQSSRTSEVIVAPGNAGTAGIAENVPIPATDLDALVRLATRRQVDLVVVGPEIPLALGLVDAMQAAGLPTFGPTRDAALLESSKAFAHEVMDRCGVPCAASRAFTRLEDARDFAATLRPPFVVKADGLAAGKGAIVVETHEEAVQALTDMMQRRLFGAAGDRVVIEEFLSGKEVSLLAFTDGVHVAPMVPSCDYKRALDGDEGPNTGGMGCYTPPGFFDAAMMKLATEIAVTPVVRAMAEEGRLYRGVIYAGLMVHGADMHVLEFNARFGDPETQVILPRLESDLADVLVSCAQGTLDPESIRWKAGCSVGVVVVSGGYPGNYEKGRRISGLDRLDGDVTVFHAGTALDDSGRVVTDGGRVLSVVATGRTMAEARERVYGNVERISFEGMRYRTDIALREVA
jgi:phosphoribosylamine--glycine ligase